MKVSEMHLAGGTSKIKAYFDVVTEEGITIKGFKIAEGVNGLFVGMPSEQDRKDRTKYWDRVVMSREMKDALLQLALPEYERQRDGAASGGSMPPEEGPLPF
jgi:DNA-binding cell septation regulator SpoVG